MQDFLKINDNDNVVVALNTIPAGEKITVSVGDGQKTVTAREEIPAGHKMAIFDIPEGGEVIKYGYRIGNAKENIAEGSWIHTHNVKTALGDLLEYTYNPTPVEEKKDGRCDFYGLQPSRRQKSGVRNEIWVIPTVGCVNNVATAIAKQANAFVKGGVEEVIAFPHPYGCSQMGDDQEHTRKILADLINHPNAGGVLVLGLGCENSNIDVLKPYIGDYDENRVKFLVCQEHEDEIADSVEIDQGSDRLRIQIRERAHQRQQAGHRHEVRRQRRTVRHYCEPLSRTFLRSADLQGWHHHPDRGSRDVRSRDHSDEPLCQRGTVPPDRSLINDFKNYFKSHNQTIYENPSPGNKKGGISTLEDKSLGCTQKSGSALVKGVLQYGDTVKTPGLNLLSAPGNDLVAATALAAAGAHIVLFTTGRGTPFASPVPTMKIATNSRLAGKKSNWIDFNAGVLVEDKTMEEETKALFDLVVETASGKQVCSEAAGFHDMAIFKQGVTL